MAPWFLGCCGSGTQDRSDERRRIALGDAALRRQYPNNAMRSSKYNALTFLPMNLWEQFHRPINLYFVIMAALQFIPNVAPVSPYTAIFPITVAFLIGAAKEAVDDVRRHRQDAENNSRRHTILDVTSRQWREVRSEEIHVGDVILLRPFESAPCDVVVLMASSDDGEAYISTESLDGETGTKARYAALRDMYDPALMTAHSDPVPGRSRAPSSTFESAEAGRGPTSTRNSFFNLPAVGADELRDAVAFLQDAELVVDSEGPNASLHSYDAVLHVGSLSPRGTGAAGGRRRNSLSVTERGARPLSAPSRSRCNSFTSVDEREALLSAVDGAAAAEEPVGRTRGSGRHRALGLSIDNVILASSTMRNTRATIALVVFTGMETKVAMTRGAVPTKWASIDNTFNRMALAIFALQLGLLVLYSVLSVHALSAHRFWYLGGAHMVTDFSEYFPVMPLRFFTMLSPMVPLSFKVMVDISKAYVSSVIRWDDDLSSSSADGAVEHATVNNSALAEDLGQVEYILSDKTGTLTVNIMTLVALATADGVVYARDAETARLYAGRLTHELAECTAGGEGAESAGAKGLRALLAGMAYCNTMERSLLAGVVAPPLSERDARRRRRGGGRAVATPAVEPQWMSTSPDEVALVEALKACGSVLLERTRRSSRARLLGVEEEVDIVKVVPFSSARARMSVLVRRSDADAGGAYTLLTKGSDERVLPLCLATAAKTPTSTGTTTAEVLAGFSARGLRTLVYAYRTVPSEEAAAWLERVAAAEGVAVADGRAERLEQAYAEMERDLTYCGCTAVEDQLQTGVADTIARLRNANVRVWMLTGDRAELARQTAIACGLLTSQDRVLALNPAEVAGHVRPMSQRLLDIRACVRGVMTQELPHLRATLAAGAQRTWLQRWLARTGLQAYVGEFVAPLSHVWLKPLNHPLRTARSLRGAPVCEEAVRRVTTLAEGEGGAVRAEGYSLLLSGSTIEAVYTSGDVELERDFSTLLLHAGTVICSRTAPDKKAKIVEVVRRARRVTLAVGDGGNDVAMIRAAHVGVGIKGKEGSQAALAADFAVAEFRFLAKLLLVHGHTAYQRTAVIVQQSFWKSVLIAWVQMLFNLFTDFSGVSYWDSYSLALYNAIPTVPVTFLCVMDVVLSPWQLMRNPQLYSMSQSGRYLSAATFYGYVARAIFQGTLIFFLAAGINAAGGAVMTNTGWTMDRSGDFYAAYFAVVTIHTYTVLTESHSIMCAHWQCFLFSVWSCFLCFWLYASSPTMTNPTFRVLLGAPHFYLSYGILTSVVCGSQSLFAVVKVFWFPDVLQLQRTAGVVARAWQGPHADLLAALFEDDNPSHFWRSWSPIHALLRSQAPPPPRSMMEESDSESQASVYGSPVREQGV